MIKSHEMRILEDIALSACPTKEKYHLDDSEFCKALKNLADRKLIEGGHFVSMENDTLEPFFLDLDLTPLGESIFK
jgi:hypothetical protein